MKFVRDEQLGRGWGRSECGRYRIARMQLHLGDRFAAYSWLPGWDDLPELLDTFDELPAAVRACELNAKYGGVP